MISLPRDDIEKQRILQRIAEKFEDGKVYTEDEVNSLILLFNVDDHVVFRRELVNFGYLNKDSYKGTYWLRKKILSEDDLIRIRKVREALRLEGIE